MEILEKSVLIISSYITILLHYTYTFHKKVYINYYMYNYNYNYTHVVSEKPGI